MEPIQQQQGQAQGPSPQPSAMGQQPPSPGVPTAAPGAQGGPQDPSLALGPGGQLPTPDQAAQGPAQPPVDPIQAVVAAIMSMPGPEAIRQVYQTAASAARAKTQLQAAGSQLDARAYHQILSQAPEVRYAKELLAARRELDGLAGERRRLGLEAQKARSAGNNARASIYEIQATQADAAMEQVACGTLLFLALPAHALNPQSVPDQNPQSSTSLSAEGA